jgi:serine/threonine protein kinase
MPSEEKNIETLISKSQLTEALARFNTFLELCDEKRDFLINLQSQTSSLQEKSLGGRATSDDEIERNRVTWSFTKEISQFRRELSNYFKVGDNAQVFEKIKNRDEIILKALKSRVEEQRQYKIGKQLNDGNSSLIFELKQHYTQQDAIALVLKVPELSKETKDKFISITALKHRNIIKLLDHELNNFPFFVITEYIHGGSLAKAIAQIGPRPLAQAIDWLYQLADALDYMRHKDILHTNVRPSKIYVDEDLNIMISPFDFNMGNKKDRTFSRFQDVCLYGSPELVLSDGEPLSSAAMYLSDQYSLGLIAYFILTGKDLFAGNSIQEILENRRRFSVDKQYRAEKLAVFPTSVLGAIFRKLLNEDTSKRYINLHEVVVALHPYTHNTEETHSINSVRNSYRRCLAKNRMLIGDFYTALFKNLPDVKDHFKNPKRQVAMLQMAVDILIDIDEKRPLLDALMKNEKHARYKDNKDSQFEVFIDTLIETIAKNDPQWTSVQSAWQVLRDKTIMAIQEALKNAE